MPKAVADLMQEPTPMEGSEPAQSETQPAAKAGSIQAHQSMLNIMRDKYAKEKRVKVKVHNDGPVSVQVNGYTFLIREGVAVEVPESIALLLDQAGYI